jgi:hypothetical protein
MDGVKNWSTFTYAYIRKTKLFLEPANDEVSPLPARGDVLAAQSLEIERDHQDASQMPGMRTAI